LKGLNLKLQLPTEKYQQLKGKCLKQTGNQHCNSKTFQNFKFQTTWLPQLPLSSATSRSRKSQGCFRSVSKTVPNIHEPRK